MNRKSHCGAGMCKIKQAIELRVDNVMLFFAKNKKYT